MCNAPEALYATKVADTSKAMNAVKVVRDGSSIASLWGSVWAMQRRLLS